jgi:hypothetical protein
MSDNNFARDYVDVATRLAEFREKYPEGSLQPADLAVPYRVLEVGDQLFLVVVAAAYRTPDDARPGVGMAQELIPGRTPYTKGSELQNAETSAWGRAIVAVGAADTKKGVASADEVRNREADRTMTRETDLEWLAGFETRVTMAGNPAEVRGLWGEATQMFAEGKVSEADSKRLAADMTARTKELKAELSAVTA